MKRITEHFKIEKKNVVNILLIIGILVLLFTPLGFQVKVLTNRLLSGNPAMIRKESQPTLDNYNWNLGDALGNTINLESKKGKVLIINFWATWCPPCVAEMPGFQSLYEDYGNKVDFFFVAEDERDKVDVFLRKKGYTFPVYYSESKTPDILYSKSIPTTYVINKQGKIVVDEVGAADWNSTKTRSLLDSLLEEN